MSYEEFEFFAPDEDLELPDPFAQPGEDAFRENGFIFFNRQDLEERFGTRSSEGRQIKSLTEDMQLLVGDCIEGLTEEGRLDDLEIVRDRMRLLIKQGGFWLKQENEERYIYDLQDFLHWLCRFVNEGDIS
jgi:hypothetical protein